MQSVCTASQQVPSLPPPPRLPTRLTSVRRRPRLEAVEQVPKLGARLFLAQADGGEDALLDVAPAGTKESGDCSKEGVGLRRHHPNGQQEHFSGFHGNAGAARPAARLPSPALPRRCKGLGPPSPPSANCGAAVSLPPHATPVDAQRAAANLDPVVDQVISQGSCIGQGAAVLQRETRRREVGPAMNAVRLKAGAPLGGPALGCPGRSKRVATG